jgi:NAD(P)H dehydrogenase (quinone)
MSSKKTKRVMIIFYSMFGHVEKLAREIYKGVNSIEGVKGELWLVPETLPEQVLKAMKAPKKPEDVPPLTFDKLDKMVEADGFLFGMPTRFGMMPAQCKTLWDQTGKYWVKGSFAGKPAGVFFSTSSQAGGQETTGLTTVTQLAHHGMVFVPLGYTFGPEGIVYDEIRGGSAYGSGTFSGTDNSRHPTELELKIAKYQGESFAKFVNRLI